MGIVRMKIVASMEFTGPHVISVESCLCGYG